MTRALRLSRVRLVVARMWIATLVRLGACGDLSAGQVGKVARMRVIRTPRPMRGMMAWALMGVGRVRIGLRGGLALLVTVLSALMATPAAAATFTVNTIADSTPTGSECMGVAGDCTLRQAIDKANFATTSSVIGFSLPAGSTISLTNGPLTVGNNYRLTITGSGANELTVNNSGAAPNGGVFVFNNNAAAKLSGVTVSGGTIDTNLAGAGIDYSGTGVLTLDGVVVSRNSASSAIYVTSDAGGVRQDGTALTIRNSTISGNSVYSGSPFTSPSAGNAGGIYNSFSGRLTLINTTVAENTVAGAGGSPPDGGGILNDGTLTTVNATIAGNSAGNGAGGVEMYAGSIFGLANTIVATNSGSYRAIADCSGTASTPTSQGYNLIGNGDGCGLTTNTGDQVGTSASPVDPLLGTLGSNGGSTPTMALLTGSPAIDAGNPAPVSDSLPPPVPPTLIPCPTTDQRGFTRPDVSGTACDIGAFETQSPPPSSGASASITNANGATFTVGSAGSFTVTTSGNPTASLSESGTLPSGVSFHDNGDGTATLAGTPASGTGGSYPVTITAHNGVGSDATQSFTLTVNQAAAITSAANATFTVGSAGSFTFTSTGRPTASLSESGALPSGVSFHDNGDGTATLAGTPASGTGGSYPVTITAHNGVGSDAVQSFTLTVGRIPQSISVTSSPPSPAIYGGSYTPAASGGGSGNPVVFSVDASSNAGACSISGGSVSFTGVGKCVIDANQAGNADYQAAPQVQQTFTITAPFAPGGGSFVIGDGNSAIGSNVTFWGARWAKLNSLSGGPAPASFKGFAMQPSTPACGVGWSADPGTSSPPPAGPLPPYMAVIVTSSASKSGSTISGNTPHIVIIKTNPGYAPNPGKAGTGTVVSQVC